MFEQQTLSRFEAHRHAWAENEALRSLYARWYGMVRGALVPPGPFVEIGSGPGFAREFIPDIILTDVVQAPWHDRRVSADALPFGDGELGGIVLFDVLHHLPSPARFWAEAARALRPGGRVVLCEPYVSPLSYPIYRFLHEEGLQMNADPLADSGGGERDPFAANQAIPTLLFNRTPSELERRFPSLRIVKYQRLAGPTYPASGGFSRRPYLPKRLWRALVALEDRLPEVAFKLIGFRLFAIVEKTPPA